MFINVLFYLLVIFIPPNSMLQIKHNANDVKMFNSGSPNICGITKFQHIIKMNGTIRKHAMTKTRIDAITPIAKPPPNKSLMLILIPPLVL